MAQKTPQEWASFWWGEVEASERAKQPHTTWWQANLDAYAPKATDNPKTYGERINTNRDFTLVEQKRAQLFFHCPEVTLKPAPLMQGQTDALLTHEAVVNEYLGPDRVDAGAMIDLVLFDLLCPAGFGITKMGYESVTEDVETEVATGIDPLTGQPLMTRQSVPVPIKERVFWERISPMAVLIPATWTSTEYDKAPWLGYRFGWSLNEARQRLVLPPDFEGTGAADDAPLTFEQTGDRRSSTAQVVGVELWYRAAVYDETVKHPDRLRRIVLVRGIDDPVVHADSPYQDVDPQTGRLTPTSFVGYPIHILTTRNQSDSAYVMSDCSVSRPQVNELNRFREQQILLRDSNIPLRVLNADVVPTEVQAKIARAEYGAAPIPMPAEFFASENLKEIAKATYPRENFVFEDKQDADIARTHAMDANQAGVQNDTARTATELQLIQSNSTVRLDKERNKVLQWYVKGVTKFSTLVQRYVTEAQAAEIVGRERARVWAQTMPLVPAALAFDAAPDSALRVDATQRRKIALEKYQYFRNDPEVSAGELLKNEVFPAMGMDTRSLAKPVPPPPTQPEPPKASISIKGDDLNPMMPQYTGVLLVLKASGLDVSSLPPPAPIIQPTVNPGVVQPEPGLAGAGPGDQTGGMQGMGGRAPIAPGGAGLRARLED